MGYPISTGIIGGADFPTAGLLLEEFMSFVSLVTYCLPALLGIACYVLLSWGLYAIAERRGIRHAWFAWVPVLNRWILGSISDQYQYITARKIKNKRKWLLGLSFVPAVLSVVLVVLAGVFLFSIFAYGYSGANGWDAYAASGLGSLLGIIVVNLATAGIFVAMAVVQYIALNDLYQSCDPANSTAFLLLSIFVPVSIPILLFICRNKDQGMPPRKVAPAQIPVEPRENSKNQE